MVKPDKEGKPQRALLWIIFDSMPKETIMRMELSTRDVSIEEFEKMHGLINGEISYIDTASEEIRNMLVKGVAKIFAIEKVKSEQIKYSKVEVDAIINDPSLNTYDSSKPIIVNFSVYSKI